MKKRIDFNSSSFSLIAPAHGTDSFPEALTIVTLRLTPDDCREPINAGLAPAPFPLTHDNAREISFSRDCYFLMGKYIHTTHTMFIKRKQSNDLQGLAFL